MSDSPEGQGAPLDEATRKRLKAVERAFSRNNELLLAWLIKKFKDESTARDIAQEAFLRVWRWALNFEVHEPRALIFKTAANLAANEFTARKRHRSNHVDMTAIGYDNSIEAIAADQPSPERVTSARQDYEICMKVIQQLPDKARRAFIMSRFEAMTYREISRQLGVSESSVEKYIITALKDLRKVVVGPLDENAASLSSHVRKTAYLNRQNKKKKKSKGLRNEYNE